MSQKRESFGSSFAAVMALAGSAIGLGNIWRFPYMAGENGGAVFVLVYIASTILVSLPVFLAELTIGRRSQVGAQGAMAKLRPGKKIWSILGFFPVFIPLLIASYYSVIGGWSLDMLFKSLSFSKIMPEEATGLFSGFVTRTWAPVITHLLFLGLTCIIVAAGVKSGIEKFSKYTIPLLFVLVVLILIYSVTLPNASAGIKYLLKPDWSMLSPRTFAYAMGQSFYSLSLGMGTIITYGSYVRKKENLVKTSFQTAASDLSFALLAGFAIMPAVFAAGIAPGAGPGLLFQSLPYVFTTMGESMPVLSTAVSFLFFFTVMVAALTSCISLVEVGVAFLCDKHKVKRPIASAIIFLVCGIAGVFCSLSFGPLSDFTIAGKTIFDLFDWFASNILLLFMAFVSVLFAGFFIKKEELRDEITNAGTVHVSPRFFNCMYFLMKWVAPIAVVIIFISNFVL